MDQYCGEKFYKYTNFPFDYPFSAFLYIFTEIGKSLIEGIEERSIVTDR